MAVELSFEGVYSSFTKRRDITGNCREWRPESPRHFEAYFS